MLVGGFDKHDYWVPEHVREHLRMPGYQLPLEDMEGHIQEWVLHTLVDPS